MSGRNPKAIDVATFQAGYGSHGLIWVEDAAACDVCHAIGRCVSIDNSYYEYATGCICRECIAKAFAKLDEVVND